MKRLLMIAYDFPPMLPGVRRTVAFARYLRDFGWEPVILTVKPVRSWAYDNSPLEEFERLGIPVYRASSWDPHRLAYLAAQWRAELNGRFGVSAPATPQAQIGGAGSRTLRWLRRHWYCPDDRIHWVGSAVRMAKRLIRDEKISAFYTTSFPHSCHLAGHSLKQRFKGMPWLADFRDGWTQNADFFPNLSPRLQQKSAVLERAVAQSADAITGVSENITQHLAALAPGKIVRTIPNGFDERDIAQAQRKHWDGFSLVYAGTLFGMRGADPLLAGAREATRENAELAQALNLVFVGKFGAELPQSAHEHGLRQHLTLTGPLPYLESLGAQKGADALVALVPDTPHAEIMLTQKIFEYIGCGRPVLAIAPARSALARLVLELRAGIVCDPADIHAISSAILMLFQQNRSGEEQVVAAERRQRFSRKAQTGQLASILDLIVAPETKKP